MDFTNIIKRFLCIGGSSNSSYAGDTTKRSSNRAVSLDPVREAAIARAQKGRSDVQSTSGRRVVENGITSGDGEWACSVCTLHNPVSLFCTQQAIFLTYLMFFLLSAVKPMHSLHIF